MSEVLTVGSLFAGIGGFDLGLERAGMRVVWQCEQDPFCRRVLARHWPGVPCYPDVRGLRELCAVDVLCGGFPCPIVSQAARGRNVAEWLWPEFARLIRDIRPRYVIVENVAGLLARDRAWLFGEILGDLAACGFDATWRVLDAASAGAPHHRARVWLVAYPHEESKPDRTLDAEMAGLPQLYGAVRRWPDPPHDLGVAHGIPARVDRLRALGNSLVPQIAEWIGRQIISWEAGSPVP